MKYAEEVEQHLGRLCEIDYYRKEYYSDLGTTRHFLVVVAFIEQSENLMRFFFSSDSKYKLENSIERHFVEFKDSQGC